MTPLRVLGILALAGLARTAAAQKLELGGVVALVKTAHDEGLGAGVQF